MLPSVTMPSDNRNRPNHITEMKKRRDSLDIEKFETHRSFRRDNSSASSHHGRNGVRKNS